MIYRFKVTALIFCPTICLAEANLNIDAFADIAKKNYSTMQSIDKTCEENAKNDVVREFADVGRLFQKGNSVDLVPEHTFIPVLASFADKGDPAVLVPIPNAKIPPTKSRFDFFAFKGGGSLAGILAKKSGKLYLTGKDGKEREVSIQNSTRAEMLRVGRGRNGFADVRSIECFVRDELKALQAAAAH